MREGLFLLQALITTAQSAAAQSEVARERSALMRSLNQEALGPLREIARGQKPFDVAVVQNAHMLAEGGLKHAAGSWPPNSPSEPKARFASSPKVWEDRASFDQKLR